MRVSKWVGVWLTVLLIVGVACHNGENNVNGDVADEAPAGDPSTLPPITPIVPLSGYSSEGVSVTLEWEWIRKLNPNERFDVRVWLDGQPELGITLISVPRLTLDNWLVFQTPGTYNWRVYVVQVEGDQVVRTLTPDSEIRQFTVDNVDDPAKALILPDGFTAALFASVGNPTSMAMDGDGNLFVSTLLGDILVIPAGTDQQILYASQFDLLTSLMWHEDTLFVSSNAQVTLLQDTDGDWVSDTSETLFEEGELPGRQYDSHNNNGLAIGPDRMLYILVGGTTDHGPEEHGLGGTVLQYDLEARSYTVFAEGVRNPYDLAFDANGNLYASDNGPDAPDLNLLSVPPDEINLIEEGKHYGYPDYFGEVLAESGTESPVVQFPASSAPTGMLIYDGNNFPAEYDGAIFAALWGNAAINHPTGHRIAVITSSDDGYAQGSLADFARGLRRPIEVIQSPAGTLLIADFETGRIFEITYTGS